jgi:hypothetical protein
MKLEKPDPGSLPDLLELIRNAYEEASDLIPFMSMSRHYAVNSHELTTVTWFIAEDEQEDAEAVQHEIERHKAELVDRAEALRKHGEKVDQRAKAFGKASQEVSKLFEFSFAELGSYDKRNASVLRAIAMKHWDVKRWIRETIAFLALAKAFPVPMTIEQREKVQSLADQFPIDQPFLDAVGERLLLERSVLLRNAKAYAETTGIEVDTSPKTTPKTTRELSPKQKKDKADRQLVLSGYETWQKAVEERSPGKRTGPKKWREAWQQVTPKAINKKTQDAFDRLAREELAGRHTLDDEIKLLDKIIRAAKKTRAEEERRLKQINRDRFK